MNTAHKNAVANTRGGGSTNVFVSFSVFGGEWAKHAGWQAHHQAQYSSSQQNDFGIGKAGTWVSGPMKL